MPDKITCTECEWQGTEDDLLTAQNPFTIDETIYGCPKCKSIDQFAVEPTAPPPHERK